MNAIKRMSSRSVVHALPAVALAGLGLLAPRTAEGQSYEAPDHLYWADTLVNHIEPEDNEYGGGTTYVNWAGVGGATEYRSRSFCTSFVTHVLKQAYQLSTYDISMWFGSTSPNAIRYRDAIAGEIGFEQVLTVGEIEAGDIVAIVYPEGSTATGHVAIAAGAAAPRAAVYPYITGTIQYELAVLDSSTTGHGLTDTRRKADGTWHPGVGRGVMRLYANSYGAIVGHTWSVQSGSIYYSKRVRDIVIGRVADSYVALPVPH
ncbi:hypothetical protein BE08_13605 [Sorangium cellulosum]|uniref:Peptidase C51 domain-containing protein n=1 Tax=Sorangium cellulosum TaxID=56 RepID=A0A150P8D2_SORCE|nr:hypothetical protein BE08_13605 [Sorangium cellulosum]